MKNCHAACFIPFDRTKKRNKGSNSLIRPHLAVRLAVASLVSFPVRNIPVLPSRTGYPDTWNGYPSGFSLSSPEPPEPDPPPVVMPLATL